MSALIKSTGTRFAVAALTLSLLMGTSGTAHAQSLVFTTNLTVGSSGAEVSALQNFLISKGYNVPAGATGYFGAQTQSALAGFQAAQGIVPAVGYFGPITRAKINATASTPSTPSNPKPDTEQASSNTSGLKGGEASLERLKMNSGDDNQVAEGATADIAEIEFKVADGDARINRADLTFVPTVGNDQSKPWKSFKTITLIANGKTIATKNVSTKGDWLSDTDPYVLRFTDLNYVVRQNKLANIIVSVEAQNGVVDSGNTDTWTVSVGTRGIRAVDSEGLQQYVGDSSETTAFDLVEEGDGEKLNLRSSTKNPEATTLEVKDTSRSDWYPVFIFDLEAKEHDVTLDHLPVDFTTGTENVRDVVDSVRLVVDRTTYKNYTWNGTGTFASTTFDFKSKAIVDKGDRVPVEVQVRFKSANGANYASGETVRASVVGANIEAEGSNDLTPNGNATGETHSLAASGLISKVVTSSVDQNTKATPDAGTFQISFKVTAFGDDIFVSATSSTEDADFGTIGANSGISYVITGTSASAVDLDSSAEQVNGSFRIREGRTETITISVAAGGADAFSQLKLGALQYGTSESNNQAYTLRLDPNSYKTTTVYLGSN